MYLVKKNKTKKQLTPPCTAEVFSCTKIQSFRSLLRTEEKIVKKLYEKVLRF